MPQPFDPAHAEAPSLSDGPDHGGFVLLVAASGAADRDWAERSATSLAAGWARQGRRILLADLSLTRPGLHRVLGVPNREGVSDTFLFGSSIQRVAQPVRDQGFLFVPAGTATARPDAVTGSSRWGAVVEGCARVQATLVVFLPSDLPGGETLLDRASDVVLLTDRAASGSEALQAGLGERLRAVLIPPSEEDFAPPQNGDAEELAVGVVESMPLPPEESALEDEAPLPLLDMEPDTAAVEAEPTWSEVAASPEDSFEFPEVAAPADPSFDLPADVPAEAAPDFGLGALESGLADVPPFEPAPAPSPAAAAPTQDAEESMFAIADAGVEDEPGSAPADAEATEPLPTFGEIEVEPPVAEPGFQFTEISDAPPEDAPAAGDGLAGMDLDSLPPGGVMTEEVPSFTGELAFFEAEPEPAPGPAAAAPIATTPAWAQSAAAGPAQGGGDLRAADIPMREADAPGRDRPRPTPRPRPETKPAGRRPAEKPKSAKATSRGGVLVFLMLLLLGGVGAAAWFGMLEVPWLSEFLAARFDAPTTTTAAPAPPPPDAGPVATGRPENGYALTLDSFTDPALARLQASSLNEQRPDLLFVVAPVSVNRVVYYRLLAGPVADSASAEALRGTLASVLTREDPADWVLRPTPLAFNMGDRDDLGAAAERVSELSRVDIPAYVLELPGRNAAGARIARYRVYAGAYADEQEAAYLRNQLAGNGFPDARLVPRIGAHPR